MRDPKERLQDILEAIERIRRYSERGRSAFDTDELIQSWFARPLQVIGEAARGLPEEVRALSPDIPWREIVGMRHILVHDYFGVDTEAVWKTAVEDLLPLEARVKALLALLGGDS